MIRKDIQGFDSFESFYKSYYPRLAAFSSFFLKNDEIHDVVQDVFLSFLETEVDCRHLNAYLYKTVKNKCIDYLRRQDVKNQYSSELRQKLLHRESEYFYASHNEIEASFFSKELQERIEMVVDELPPKGKQIFKLFFFQHKTAKEIGQLLNLSLSTVENHIYNNLKVVRQKCSNYLPFFLILLSKL
jgi:RNA polymerase sigma-70 factor (ECF subfamily)